MIVETNEVKLLAIVAAHVLLALLIAALVAMLAGVGTTGPACVTASLGVVSGVLHATRLLRREILKAHTALSEAVVIVDRSHGVRLSPNEFASRIEGCVTDRLAGFRFRLVTVRFGVPAAAQ